MAKAKADKAFYGTGEWYGDLFRNLSTDQRQKLLEPTDKPTCRFLADTPALAPMAGMSCSKPGGVCTLCNFIQGPDGLRFGPLTATCPNRFLEGGLIVRTIGRLLLGTETPLIAKEIPFLKRVVNGMASDSSDVRATGESETDVGYIDMVCAHPNGDRIDWCAVELQAVYFSGSAMAKDRRIIKAHQGQDIPQPGGARRPDFRSSGPKRLMPQLQIKVPTLRRWGKKMVVVVDEPFFQAIGPMDCVGDISNCDIVWLVVRFEVMGTSGNAEMSVAGTYFTTLERAVEGLTAGVPTTLTDFESKLLTKLPSADV